jgi:REP-associated tyrosine transposase
VKGNVARARAVARVEWLTPHGEYLALGSEESKRLAAYRGLFPTDLDAELLREIRISTHGGYAIGIKRFREQIEQALNQRATPRGPGRPRDFPPGTGAGGPGKSLRLVR